MNTYVIGDIHGGYKALIQLFERSPITKGDRLIFLGDYVDGWSDSPILLDFLIEINEIYQCIFLRGNHDELVYDWLTGNREHFDETSWFKHGGKATMQSYELISEEVKKKHLEFLKSLKNYFIDESNNLFIHAGFTNLNGIQQEYFPKMYYWDRTLWEMVLCMDSNLTKDSPLFPNRLRQFQEIFIGHTPTTRIGSTLPINKINVWNLDTGAAFNGPLTIMNVTTKEFWQSDLVKNLYEGEEGRN